MRPALDPLERSPLMRQGALEALEALEALRQARPAACGYGPAFGVAPTTGTVSPTTLDHSRRGAHSGCACDAKLTVQEAGRKS